MRSLSTTRRFVCCAALLAGFALPSLSPTLRADSSRASESLLTGPWSGTAPAIVRGQSLDYEPVISAEEPEFSSYLSADGGPIVDYQDAPFQTHDCSSVLGNWWQNTEVFVGGDTFRNVGDVLGVFSMNGTFGLRTGMNTGFSLGGTGRTRGQFGMSYGMYDMKGRFGDPDTPLENQAFITFGVYHRSDVAAGERWSGGLVYDVLFNENWGVFAQDFTIGQVRWIGGWAAGVNNEFGLWGTWGTQQAAALTLSTFALSSDTIRPMDQVNAFWRYHWSGGGESMLYFGTLTGADIGDWQFGFQGRAPLSERTTLYAGANYVVPSENGGYLGAAQEIWNFSLGLSFSLGNKARADNVSGQAGLPLLPVADNSSLLLSPK